VDILSFSEIYMSGSNLTVDREITTSISHTIHGGALTFQNITTFESFLTLDDVDLTFEEDIFVILESPFSIVGNCHVYGLSSDLRVYGSVFVQQNGSFIIDAPTLFDFSHSSSFILPVFFLDGELINNKEMKFRLDKDTMDISGDGRIINDGWFEISCQSDMCKFEIGNEIVGSGDVIVKRNTSVAFLSVEAKQVHVYGQVTIEKWKGAFSSLIVVNDVDAVLSFSSDNFVERINLVQGLQKEKKWLCLI